VPDRGAAVSSADESLCKNEGVNATRSRSPRRANRD